LARWLAARGAPRLVLAGRRGPGTPGTAAVAAALAGAGTAVAVAACDLTDRDQAAGLVAWAATAGPPLTAVIHAALSVTLQPVDATGLDQLQLAMGAKTGGAAVLDELTAGAGLTAFVLFSSIAATWGVRDHGTYAAANAYLDALAEERRARGLPATSVAWGVWDSGLRFDPGQAALMPPTLDVTRLTRQGMRLFEPERALAALGQVLDADETVPVVADVDWERFSAVYTAARRWRLLDQIDEAGPAAAAAPATSGELATRLAGLDPAEREQEVTGLVCAHAAAVLGYSADADLDPGRAFRDMGFDSLTAVELRDRVNAASGLALPSTVVFDYPSPGALAREIIARLPGGAAAPPSRPVPVFAAAPGEPIAIVGMGCRFPGGVTSPEQLWELLASGTDAVGGFPADRGWNPAGLFHPDPDNPGTSYCRDGGFVTGAGDFDPAFFGISPREALAMDPQQRLLLAASWEAIERAGIDPASLRGTATGVFAGAAAPGYAGPDGGEGHLITGNATSVISGRVSYVLGLEGPAVTLDTACSSALVALHLACQALRSGECSAALAGGVVVIADPGGFVGFSRQRALAADGRCKAFSASADGMGLAEGTGMVLLERLSDARRSGHPVLAVITGSAVNQDGASNGLTAPNGPAQQRVIRAALASARLSADDVDAVEAHGTGTPLGDPIEAQALIATYGQHRDRPLWLGSVKSNIGHTQAAAGAAGLIKMVLALRHQVLPRTLHADEPSPHVDWAAGDVRLLTEPVPWPVRSGGGEDGGGRPRRAGISSFGISGTNAHLILEEAPEAAAPPEAGDGGDRQPAAGGPVFSAAAGAPVTWLVSGRSLAALQGQAGRLGSWAAGAGACAGPVDVAWSLAATRSVFEYRAVVSGQDRAELLAGLEALAAGRSGTGAVSGRVRPGGPVRAGFLFAGQG
ncbi:MAG TPA: beta-ketoacyl synthase N-terminal-like domain-containing protein, partial [Trebonia sp.]